MNLKDYPILYVDDDNANRVVIKHNLGPEFTLLIADSGPAALAIMAEQRIAVLLTDQRMPGMTGVDLAERALQLHPDVVRVIITAYSDLDATIDAINRARINRFIKKPWTRDELVAVMRESVASYHNARLAKELQQRLAQIDRATTVAVMASAIGHDLRQPIAIFDMQLQMLARDVSELARVQGAIALPRGAPRLAELVESLNATAHDLGQGLANMKRITEAILSSLREREAARARLDLRRVVQSAITICRTTVEERAMLRVELPPEEVPLVASEGKLLQLTINLLLNAAQSIPGGGLPVQHLVRLELRSEATGISLAVEDSGCGIPAEKREVIFQPFFTTKGAQGTGLGLAICKQIVEEMAGSISVESMPGRGSRFLVKLPPPVL